MTVARSVSLPTSARDWRTLARTLRLVLTIPRYAVGAALGAGAAMTLFVLSQNLQFAEFALTADGLSLGDRLTLLGELYPFVGSIYSPAVSVALLVLSLLVGANLAMTAYHVRDGGLSGSGSAGSVLGVVLGTLGAGCAACGAALLTGLLSLVGAAGLLTLLPLEGLEIAILAGVVIVLSMHWIAQGLRGSRIRGCPVDV
jgi:hypothetical protein